MFIECRGCVNTLTPIKHAPHHPLYGHELTYAPRGKRGSALAEKLSGGGVDTQNTKYGLGLCTNIT